MTATSKRQQALDEQRQADSDRRRQIDRDTIASLSYLPFDWLIRQRRLLRRALRAKRRREGRAS